MYLANQIMNRQRYRCCQGYDTYAKFYNEINSNNVVATGTALPNTNQDKFSTIELIKQELDI